jgi:hypothetical protein
MTTMTIRDLPKSRALDYRAMSVIKGAGGAPWVFGAFRAFQPESARIVPVINFYQITNYIADQLTLQFLNINVDNSAANSTINVNAGQNALTFNLAPVLPQP